MYLIKSTKYLHKKEKKMPTVFKDGIISKDGVNQGVQVPVEGTTGQNPAAGGFPDIAGDISNFASGVVGGIKDIGQDIFGGGDDSKGFMSALRGKNLPGKGNNFTASKSPASFTSGDVEEKDWRVSLSLPSTPSAYKNSPMFSYLALTNNKMVFPFTPTILLQHSANYQSVAPLHNNYPYFAYENSNVNEIVITGQFYVQNELDAQYWTACLHFLRSVTKMDFGAFAETGAPPPICKLNGYGDYVFNNVPVVITTFTVDMPSEVDYIATGIKGKTLNAADEYSWAPSESQFSVSLQPVYSRSKQSIFNYNMFVKGYDIGRGYI
jgi:hypothetical protein